MMTILPVCHSFAARQRFAPLLWPEPGAGNSKVDYPIVMNKIDLKDSSIIRISDLCRYRVVIDEFLVDGRPVKIVPKLSVPSYSNSLEFRYEALEYNDPAKISYRFVLLGFDKDWIECGSLMNAHYTNIPHGNYTFKVMARYMDEPWNQQQKTELTFQLKPPFYHTLVFYLIIAIVFLLILSSGIYYYSGRIQLNRLTLLVEERTYELNQKMITQLMNQKELEKMNTELSRAKELAESGDRLKSAFMNNISHEIRTPLNGILGFSSLLFQPDITHEEKELFQVHIEASSTRLLNTINNYMDISLIESGNIEVKYEKIELDSFFETLRNQYLPIGNVKNILIRPTVPQIPGTVPFISDVKLLRKIFSQLLDNAVKFTVQGEIDFGFHTKPGILQFFVRDTGTGIAVESQQRIFESFMQEESMNSRGYEGSGLGLSIAQGLVKLLGSEIVVESAKGMGSLFSFDLPFDEDKTDADLPEQAGHAAARIESPVILVAEDDESNYIFLEMVLKKAHATLLRAKDGQEAVDHCHQHAEISLVLMDLKMPVMDGLQATLEIKSFRKSVPIIALTAFAMNSDEKRALEAGCDDYISKPFEREVLARKLKKYGIEI